MGDSYRPRRPDRDRGPPPLADRMTFTSGGGLNYDTYRPGDSQRQQGSNRPSKHSEFTFTSGQPGPQFPPAAPSGPRQPSRRRNRGGAPGQRDSRRGGDLEPSQPHRRQNGARRGGFRKPAPHERALLQNRDGGSPERTLGVAEGPNRFLNLEDLSDDEEADMDVESDKSSGENEPSSGQEVNPKVAKVQAADRPDGSSVPKWSNPDPYTVLPPPEETTGKKRDFVKLIRKAKNQAAEKAASNGAVAANDDFISFGDDADDAVVANAKPRVRIYEDGEELGFLTNRPVEGSLNQITDLRELGNGSLNETHPAAAAGLPQRPHHPGKRPADDADLPGRPPRPERAHKRKRNEFEGGIVEAWLPYTQSKSCPWVGRASYEHLKHDPVKWLHNEIMDFHDYVRPHQQEQDIRYNLVKRIQNALGGSMFPQSRGRVYPFGSFPTGLYLPTADMDLVYTSEQFYNGGPPAVDLGVFKTANSTLRKAARRLETMHIATDAVVIARARVPIIKFVDRYTGINVDLSFENLSGVQAQATFEKWKIAYPDLQYLVALLKQFLIMRGLNDVHTGGLGGFTIICLAVNYIQNSPKTENLGELFLGFLDYYGNQFDLAKSRIQMNPPQVVDKTSVGIDGRPEKDDGLSIQDPNRPDNNISGGSHKAKDIFKTFSKGHKTLKDRIEALSTDQMPQASLLECILGGNYDSYERHRRHIRGL